MEKKKRGRPKKAEKPKIPEPELKISYSDVTLREANGLFEQVKTIIESEFPYPKTWNLKNTIYFFSQGMTCAFEMDLNHDRQLIIVDYQPSFSDLLDLRNLCTWATEHGWDTPSISIGLAKHNTNFWRDHWENSLVNSDYFDKIYTRHVIDYDDFDDDDDDD